MAGIVVEGELLRILLEVGKVDKRARIYRVIAALMLGRPLECGELVHHKNEDDEDHHPDNLKVWARGPHVKHHMIGYKHSEEMKEFLGVQRRGRLYLRRPGVTPEHLANMRAAQQAVSSEVRAERARRGWETRRGK